ncbi:hypothetical protein K469DRAFT_542118, partial [Zopfia rhizophila CBS 207.26]
PIPVPSYGPGGSFSISCSTIINAAPLTCLEIVLDTSNYPSWNRFCRRVTIDHTPSATLNSDSPLELSQLMQRPNYIFPGLKFSFEVYSNPDGDAKPRQQPLEATVLQRITEDGRTGYRVAWKMLGMPYYVLHSERVQDFIEYRTEEGVIATQYRCWETFGGLIAAAMKLSVASQIEEGFNVWAEGLR